jgi:hypothetical protein
MTIVYTIVVVIILSIILIGLSYIDRKSDYNEIVIFLWNNENGEFYFFVPYYIWQSKKVERAKEIYVQNAIIDFDGYKYQITRFGGVFSKTNGTSYFLEKELRFWGEPLNIVQSNSNTQVTINQYGSGNISIDINNNKYINEIIKIEKYISEDIHIDKIDKDVMQDFISKILYKRSMDKKEAKKAYDIFLKYEPLLSFGLIFLSVVKDFL